MLNQIKLLLGITDTSKDALLNLLIDIAKDEAISYIHSEDISDLDNVISQMVVYKYNRLGTEGVNSESYSGVNFNYSSDYPDFIINQLKSFRRVRVI